MGRFLDALGTVFSKFQIGIGGPQLKNNSGVLEARNAADSAYATISAALAKIYGNDFILNAGAAESGADWVYKLSRPSSGMTHDLQVIFPSADPTAGQVLNVVTFASNIVTLGWVSAASTAACESVDTTSIAFGSTSPVSMFTLPANAVVNLVRVTIDTAFNGAPSLSIGISGTTSKYLSSTAVDLTAAAGTVWEVAPGVAPDVSSESIIATYSAGSASAVAARVEVFYDVPV